MRQTNITGSPIQVMFDPPIEVPAGGEVDYDELLAGFAPAEHETNDNADDGDRDSTEPDTDPEPERAEISETPIGTSDIREV